MTKRRKILLILFSVAAVITLLRETGVVNINVHKTSITTSNVANWSDQGFTVELPDSIYKNGVDSADLCYHNVAEVPVELFCDDIHLGDTSSCNHVMVFVHDISYGFLSSPLYKRANFSCTVFCNNSLSFYEFRDSTVLLRQKTFSGSIGVSGTFNSFGLLSTREARRMIREHIANEVYKLVVAHVQSSQ